ncbi:hypothetical protein WN944_015004 [Citrus x changshan-huyou]|uniref:Uncharacterized protein n=1 Tax=Citrus x changshan-huyou TaxID=2935761 RepID=A0AAP0MAX3_9ROSI
MTAATYKKVINRLTPLQYFQCQKREEKEMVLDLGGKGTVAGWAEVEVTA